MSFNTIGLQILEPWGRKCPLLIDKAHRTTACCYCTMIQGVIRLPFIFGDFSKLMTEKNAKSYSDGVKRKQHNILQDSRAIATELGN